MADSDPGPTEPTNPAARSGAPAVSAVQLDQRTLDTIIAGVTAQLRPNYGQPNVGAPTEDDSTAGGKRYPSSAYSLAEEVPACPPPPARV